MGKVSIKKNVKPIKVTPKKKVPPKKKVTPKKKIEPIKEGQSQTQSVIVNVGSTGRKANISRKQSTKKPIQQPAQPSIISYNQPIFKQPIQQPTSLASSILATQQNPNVLAKELREQTTLQKALEEQNTQVDEPVVKANDLERIRSERIKKLDRKEEVKVEIKKQEPIRNALLSQLLSDKQDDTEEIKLLQPISTQTDLPFVTDSSTQTPNSTSFFPAVVTRRELGLLNRPATASENAILNQSLKYNLLDLRRGEERESHQSILLGRQIAEATAEAEEPSVQPEDIQPTPSDEETPLKQEEPKGASGMITQTETASEPTPLTQATVELGFGGLTEEPIQTSVGQILPPEPVSSTVLEVKEKNKKAKTILSPIQSTPTILQASEPEATILQAQPYVTETLVKDDGIPRAQVTEKEKTPSEQVKELWDSLKDQYGFQTSKASGRYKTTKEWVADIQSVQGYEDYKAPEKTTSNTLPPGPSKKQTAKKINI